MSSYALITGASGGIGLELAKLFARDGVNLVLVARSRESLETRARELTGEHKIDVRVIASDLSERGAAQAVYEQTSRGGLVIEFLVNNAGFGVFGEFLTTSLDEELAMLDLNCAAPTILSKLYARDMAQRRSGRILNVASTAAFQPGPLMAVYYASKSYVLMFSEALNNEFKRQGVSVTCLCPGPTPTGFQERAGNRKSGLLKLAFTSAEQVARVGYAGMLRGKSVVVPGLVNKLLTVGVRFMPRDAVSLISRFTAEPR